MSTVSLSSNRTRQTFYFVLIEPSGFPTIEPSTSQKKHAGEKAILRCLTTFVYLGNPPCDTFTWKLEEQGGEIVIKGQNVLELYVDESDTGHYKCKCSNEHGDSDWSGLSEVILLDGDSPSSSCKISFNFIALNSRMRP